ncbi:MULTISPECIES: GNAT family N-acetyltransferase [Sphingobacterium]|uniref:GNAT family N-acetyltransferase n=1 Tax=Sphingobacterium TaxID=28453 RepID=UPI0013DCF970|nr:MULTISPECIES: GNAT family N-acetyltransferase [unclassified Sphingobacterium]
MISVNLEKDHNKKDFDCGVVSLDNYIKPTAKKDISSDLAACFVIIENNNVIGYYTLSCAGVDIEEVPDDLKASLKCNYANLPVILVGRLAIDKNYQGKGLGKILFNDCLKRVLETSSIIGAFAVCVDPIDNNAKEFYQKFGFIPLNDSHRMILPIKTIRKGFETIKPSP